VNRAVRQQRAHEPVVPLPRRLDASRLLPSARSIGIGIAVAIAALVAYVAARETGVFAVRTVTVDGASPALARQVEQALAPLRGESLLRIHGDDVSRLATELPYVTSVSYDRAFPSTLRVHVVPEQPLAVVRDGIQAWLVSRRGRVIARIPQGTHRGLPRIWLPKSVVLRLGETLAHGGGAEQAAALAAVAGVRVGPGIQSVRVESGQVVYLLRSGLELRVGKPVDLPLKFAVARRILASTPVQGYLDVSVVERPVAGLPAQVSG
jgi:POTRA domain, FtsQ-type